MEAEFAEEFPEDTVFTDITAEAVKRKMPVQLGPLLTVSASF